MTPREAIWHVLERAPMGLAVVGGMLFVCCLMGAVLALYEVRVERPTKGAGR